MIASKSMKACRVAQDEITQGQVSYRFGGKKPSGDVVVEMPSKVAATHVDPHA